MKRSHRLHNSLILVDDRLVFGAVLRHRELGPLALNAHYVVWDERVFSQRLSELLSKPSRFNNLHWPLALNLTFLLLLLEKLVLNLGLERVICLLEELLILLPEVVFTLVLKLVQLACSLYSSLLGLHSDFGDSAPEIGRLVFYHIEYGVTFGAPPVSLILSCLLLSDFQVYDRLLIMSS